MSARLKIVDKAYAVIRQKKGGMIYRTNGNGSVLIIGPDRSGKSVGNVIPTIFDYRGSIFSIGYYNDEYERTSNFRRKISNVYNYEIKNSHDGCILFRDLEDINFFYNDKPSTIYVSVSKSNIGSEKMEVQRAVEKICELPKEPTRATKHSLLIILDDFLELGIVNFLEKNISLLKRWNIHFLLICQSVGQLAFEIKDFDGFFRLFSHIVFYPPGVLENLSEITDGEKFMPKVDRVSCENIVIVEPWSEHPSIIGKKIIYYDDKRYKMSKRSDGCV
jgi:hypothetical protein